MSVVERDPQDSTLSSLRRAIESELGANVMMYIYQGGVNALGAFLVTATNASTTSNSRTKITHHVKSI